MTTADKRKTPGERYLERNLQSGLMATPAAAIELLEAEVEDRVMLIGDLVLRTREEIREILAPLNTGVPLQPLGDTEADQALLAIESDLRAHSEKLAESE